VTKEEKKETKKETKEKQEGVPHLITPLLPIARQVGEHVLSALEHEETVAVLTTVTGSNHGQQVVSIPLTAKHVQQVHGFIEEIHESNEPQDIPCVGFHCFLDQEESTED
jgi:hypothetical protein